MTRGKTLKFCPLISTSAVFTLRTSERVGADTKEMLEMEKEAAAKRKTDKRKEDDQVAL